MMDVNSWLPGWAGPPDTSDNTTVATCSHEQDFVKNASYSGSPAT